MKREKIKKRSLTIESVLNKGTRAHTRTHAQPYPPIHYMTFNSQHTHTHFRVRRQNDNKIKESIVKTHRLTITTVNLLTIFDKTTTTTTTTT